MSAALKLTDLSKTFPVGKRLFGAPRAAVKAGHPPPRRGEKGEPLGTGGEPGGGGECENRLYLGRAANILQDT